MRFGRFAGQSSGGPLAPARAIYGRIARLMLIPSSCFHGLSERGAGRTRGVYSGRGVPQGAPDSVEHRFLGSLPERGEKAFAFARVDYAQISKVYASVVEPGVVRYSPPVCIGVVRQRMIGRPDPDLISTSYVEALNLTTRQNCRRFTRLTNAHSKKAENHAHAVALTFLVQNYVKAHTTLTKQAGRKTSPAMAAGLADRLWTVEDVLARMEPDFLLQCNGPSASLPEGACACWPTEPRILIVDDEPALRVPPHPRPAGG